MTQLAYKVKIFEQTKFDKGRLSDVW